MFYRVHTYMSNLQYDNFVVVFWNLLIMNELTCAKLMDEQMGYCKDVFHFGFFFPPTDLF